MLWELFTCDRDRHLGARLTGASHVNAQALQRVAGDPPWCGTLHDHQPVELAVMSHTRVWMPAHEPEPGEEPVWLARLRTAREHETFVGAAERGRLAEVVRVAEQAPDDPEVQARVLELLAEVEASRVTQRGRY